MVEIYADTADLNELKELISMGVVDGCTTNPIIVAKAGNTDYVTQIKTILDMVPGPVSVEVTTNDPDEMVQQAREFAAWGDNVVIKIPIGKAGLKAVARLSKLGIKTNVTACMSARQAIIAAKAGATYVSLFWGRIEDMGHDAYKEVKDAAEVLKMHNMTTKIIIGSIRQVGQMTSAFKSGAHILTVPTKVLMATAEHPRSESTIQEFLDKWDEFTKDSPQPAPKQAEMPREERKPAEELLQRSTLF